MSYKQTKINFTETSSAPMHGEENRLARRLFQLESRVLELENRVNEMDEMLHMLISVDAFGAHETEFPLGFCFCDEEDDDEDEDEEDF
jgi:hypothetical protein